MAKAKKKAPARRRPAVAMKRNPQDATMRNVRAMAGRVARLKQELVDLRFQQELVNGESTNAIDRLEAAVADMLRRLEALETKPWPSTT